MRSGLWAKFLYFAANRFVLRHLFWDQQLGHAKINDFDVGIWLFRLKNEVLWLQVAVSYAESVAIVDGKQHLSKELGGINLRKAAFFYNFIEKLSTLTQLGNEINIFVTLEIFIKFEDVWVVELNENVDL